MSALSPASMSRTSFSCAFERFFLLPVFMVVCYRPLSLAVCVVAFSIAAISGTMRTYRCDMHLIFYIVVLHSIDLLPVLLTPLAAPCPEIFFA